MFTVPGPALLTIPTSSVSLTITTTGLERLLSIMFKSWVSVQVAIVFAAATPFPDMLQAMRAIKIPRLIVSLFGLMWRYMFVMVDEVIRLLRARASGGAIEGEVRRRSLGAPVTGGMAVISSARSIEASASTPPWRRAADGEIVLPAPPFLHQLDHAAGRVGPADCLVVIRPVLGLILRIALRITFMHHTMKLKNFPTLSRRSRRCVAPGHRAW
jgi:cobalt/nickel transport system permease protein